MSNLSAFSISAAYKSISVISSQKIFLSERINDSYSDSVSMGTKISYHSKRLQKHCFNLLEIVLAMAIIAIGVVSIMGLFPIGLDANRQAQDNVYSTLAANMVADHLAGEMKQIEADVLYKQYQSPFADSTAHKDYLKDLVSDKFYLMDTNEKNTPGDPDKSYLPDGPEVDPSKAVEDSDGPWELVVDNQDGVQIYRLRTDYSFADGSQTPARLGIDNHLAAYRVVFKTRVGNNGQDDTVDFDCIVMCGLGEYESRLFFHQKWNLTKGKRLPGPRLAVMVQWPASKAPSKRETKTFSRRLRVSNMLSHTRRDSKGVNAIVN